MSERNINWRGEEAYVWVGEWSAHIRVAPAISSPKILNVLITVPSEPVGKEWDIKTYMGQCREYDCVYFKPDEMTVNEALKRVVRHLKKQARYMIKFVQADCIDPFTGEIGKVG